MPMPSVPVPVSVLHVECRMKMVLCVLFVFLRAIVAFSFLYLVGIWNVVVVTMNLRGGDNELYLRVRECGYGHVSLRAND